MVRSKTSPAPGVGTGQSSMRKSEGFGSPLGRAARTMRLPWDMGAPLVFLLLVVVRHCERSEGATPAEAVIPGRCEASNPEGRDSGSGPSDHPGMTVCLHPARIVRAFARDRHVVDVAFAQAGAGD